MGKQRTNPLPTHAARHSGLARSRFLTSVGTACLSAFRMYFATSPPAAARCCVSLAWHTKHFGTRRKGKGVNKHGVLFGAVAHFQKLSGELSSRLAGPLCIQKLHKARREHCARSICSIPTLWRELVALCDLPLSYGRSWQSWTSC